MSRTFFSAAGSLALLFCTTAVHADVLQFAGILGNSGEQGSTLVRYGPNEASGIGIIHDSQGSLWDRGGSGKLNRYALDGRLLASYQLPQTASNRISDAIALAGDQVLIRVGSGIYALPVDAPSGATAKPLNIPAEWMSLSSRDGWVAAANKHEIFLVNARAERKPIATLKDNISGIELAPDGSIYVLERDRLGRVVAGADATAAAGPTPGERPQFLAGAWYGNSWASTVRRFDASLHPAPGVVMGGNSGSFIGHVDEQAEVINGRGLTQISTDLFAISGLTGVVHLLQWSPVESRFTAVRRLGAAATCNMLALDREGRVWYGSGMWEWADGPTTPLRYGIPPGETFGAAMLDSDAMAAYGLQYGKPAFYHGKLNVEVKRRLEEKSTILPHEAVAAAAIQVHNRGALLILEKDGRTSTVYISADGAYEADAGIGQLLTASPITRWTALARLGPDRLAGAGDGYIVEFAREGDNWREASRWNTWGEESGQRFGGVIYLAADMGRLWVCDTTRHRVLCFDAAGKRLLATFGSVDAPGDSLSTLNAPQALAARGNRAVIFDSANQRLVRLELHSGQQ